MPGSAQTMTVDTVSDTLKIRIGGFSFLKGDPLARLKDGRSVRVELAAMVLPGPGKSAATTVRRIFALSYDLWEWCIEQLPVPINALGSLGRDVPFWVRLEYRILDSDAAPDSSDSRYTLQGLIDLLSRKKKISSTTSGQQGESEYAIEGGPFRIARGSSSPR
jgi:hypothetical protein